MDELERKHLDLLLEVARRVVGYWDLGKIDIDRSMVTWDKIDPIRMDFQRLSACVDLFSHHPPDPIDKP